MRATSIAVVISLALCSCSPSLGSSTAECITQHSVGAKSDLGARANAGFCRELFDGTPAPARKRFLECAIPASSAAGSDTGVRVALSQCNREASSAAVNTSATPAGPTLTPVVGNPFDREVPPTFFGATDRDLASRLGRPLPTAGSAELVWAARVDMFLALPENRRLASSNAALTAWQTTMQAVVNEASARGQQLDDYQVMETARDRLSL